MVNDLFQPIHLLIIFLIFIPLGIAAFVVPLWVAFKKAGLTPALSLLVVVPFGIVIVLYLLAFSRWKVVPAPDFGAGYPPPGYPMPAPYPPQGYVPATAAYPPPATPAHVSPPDPPAAI